MDVVRELLTSRKFLVFLATVLGLLAAGISGAQPWNMVVPEILIAFAAWITAHAAVDASGTKATIEADTMIELQEAELAAMTNNKPLDEQVRKIVKDIQCEGGAG